MKSRLFFMTFWLAAALAPMAGATITNDGNDAVMLEIKKESGFTEQITLYPDQFVGIPDQATEIKVVGRSLQARGDEKISVKIADPAGTSVTLKQYGQSYVLGTPIDAAAATVDLKAGTVKNKGNVIVDLEITHLSGEIDRKDLYLGQVLALPKDVVEVKVVANARMRGDEIVKVEIRMPDGELVNLSGPGASAKLKDRT
jgi:hypothetical protein